MNSLLLRRLAALLLTPYYFVDNFRMDDTNLKTLGLGKQSVTDQEDEGKVEVRIYPAGSSAPLAASSLASARSPVNRQKR
jgi:hypothetical protein